jgi:hypothetical protein
MRFSRAAVPFFDHETAAELALVPDNEGLPDVSRCDTGLTFTQRDGGANPIPARYPRAAIPFDRMRSDGAVWRFRGAMSDCM